MLEYMNQNPIIMVSFDLKPSSRSNVTLWVDILDHKNFIFLRTFQSYFQRIKDSSTFLSTQLISTLPILRLVVLLIAMRIIAFMMGSTAGMLLVVGVWRMRGRKLSESN